MALRRTESYIHPKSGSGEQWGQNFGVLRVRVTDDGQVTTWGAFSHQPLGHLARAHAEISDPTRHHRVAGATAATIVTAPVLGPLAMLGALSKKSKAIAFVVFENGRVHQRNLDGNTQIRMAQSEVVKFNALAAAAANRAAPRAPRGQLVPGQKRHCRYCGHETTISPDGSVPYVHVGTGASPAQSYASYARKSSGWLMCR